jgi:FtsP/CotA-like multicopper oxidase with cupredoxin domain
MRTELVGGALVAFVACGAAACKGEAKSTPGVAPFAEPPLLDDLDAADGRFEGVVTAAAVTLDITGEDVEFLAYNGSIPGPQVRVQQGDWVSIRFENQLPDGAEWASGIHWHGIEGYNAADGTPVTQVATMPGESFDYEFRATRAGTFWWHPHVRGAQALFSGLYAPLVVVDPAEVELIERGLLPADEHVVVLSDTWTAQGIVTSAEVDDAMEIMNGTEGRSLLVNGREDPLLEVVAGSAVRLRLVNASITRFWRLSVPGRVLYRVGGEGGLLDTVRVEGGTLTGERFDPTSGAALGSAEVDLGYDRGEIVLAPGERADVVLVTDGEVGDEWPLYWMDFARGRHGMWMEGTEMVMGDADDDGTREREEVARFRLVEGEATGFSIDQDDPLLSALGREVGQLDDTDAVQWFDGAGTTLDEEMAHSEDPNGNMVMSTWFGMNGEDWHPDHMGGLDQAEAPSAKHASLGDTLLWEVHNNSMMAHPYHLHGFSYQPYQMVLWADPEDQESDGSAIRMALDYNEFEDTTLLPAFTSLYFRVVLADPEGYGSAAGRWVQHCHILQHGENGMMSELIVDP